MIDLIKQVARELNLREFQVLNTVELLFKEECTIPFIARYRKEKTGTLDEVQIREIRDRYQYLEELESTKIKYLKVLQELAAKNPEFAAKLPALEQKFRACVTKQELEDLYLPFKPKRRTRAQIARERGLEPLAELIFASIPAEQKNGDVADLLALASPFITADRADVEASLKVATAQDALSGAADILAERFSESADVRSLVRQISRESGMLVSKKIENSDSGKEAPEGKNQKELQEKAQKFLNYFDFREPISKIPPHRVMAVRRGESEKILRVSIEVDEARILIEMGQLICSARKLGSTLRSWLDSVMADAYRRLIAPAIETELRLELKVRAESEAIKVFAKNLENLLLLPPIPAKVVMGVDPGIRTGSKLAVVSPTGKLLAYSTIYPSIDQPSSPKSVAAKAEITKMIKDHQVQYVAVGNGTGGREISKLIADLLRENSMKDVKRLFVNEAGASVYSTDAIARDEFPDLDPTIRSAISIARRLQDPLAELVKIDPRSIGVGQYQHDVNVTKLKSSLEEVVESCVNRVGVNVNTASSSLLGYVSGIGPQLAKNIVHFRDHNGSFHARDQLMKVSGFGAKAYTLAAGFLRVPESPQILDNSAVHPESYGIVESMLRDLKCNISDVLGVSSAVAAIPLERYVTENVGMPTLRDIASELVKPGRDPREDSARLVYSDDITELKDLRPGMELQGTVTNVTHFGAFVDVGVHQDGLVHISELSDEFVSDPSQVIAVGDVVKVRVLEVDMMRKRISLSCRSRPQNAAGASGSPTRAGAISASAPSQKPTASNKSNSPSRPRNASGSKNEDTKFTMDDLLKKFNRR